MASKPKSTRRRKASAGARIRRKNLNIDQNKLDRAVEPPGADSETDAIDQALDMIVFREELLASIREIPKMQGQLVNYFEGGWSDELGKR